MTENVLGNRLKELRVQIGVTQKAFAGALNVSSSAVSKWENGQNEPDMEMLLKIAVYYGISIEELLTSEIKKAFVSSGACENENSGGREDAPGSKDEDQSGKKMEPGKRKDLLRKENRVKWLGAGVALGCVLMAVVLLAGIAVWKMERGRGDVFSYEIVAGRYAEDVNWGKVYEVSVFYTGEFSKDHQDELIEDILIQWEGGSLCHEKIELITVICNNKQEQAENFEKVYQSEIIYVAPYNMDYNE